MRLPLEKYTGTYYHGGYGFIVLAVRDGIFYAIHNDQPFNFFIKGGDEFDCNVPGGRLTAVMDKKNNVIALKGNFEDGIHEIVFDKQKEK